MSLQFSVINHQLHQARQVSSPNQSARNSAGSIDLLVIHNISLPPGEFGGTDIDDLFCNCLQVAKHAFFEEIAELRVSAHLLINREGLVTQYVPFDRKAWHAGESCFSGRKNCNEFSIGVELEGTDTIPFTEIQYQVLIEVAHALMNEYPAISADRIVGHSDIAPGRKTDPGPCFDWERFRTALQKIDSGKIQP